MMVLVIAISCTIEFILGYLFARVASDKYWQKEAVDRGYAEYRPENGKWQWRDRLTPSQTHTSPRTDHKR